MSEKNSVCIICNEGATSKKRLINNPDMIGELIYCANERLSLGQGDIKRLTDRLASLGESERKSVWYHSECRKPIVNTSMIERLRVKRVRFDSPACPARGPGRPSSVADSTRPKRTKTIPKEKVCLFSSCSFCSNNISEPLHRVYSDKMGENFLEIKLKTQDDRIRTCVSELEDAGDASALEKYYHRKCLRYAQRTLTRKDRSNTQLIGSLCDEQLLLSVQNTLTADDLTLNMAEVNGAYLSILKRYNVEINQTTNFRKHLKKLITERLPNIQFVQSLRKNEPDNLVLSLAVRKAMQLMSAQLDNDDTVGNLKNMANILREEIMQHRSWSFRGMFEDFENPPLLQFFLTHLLFGRHVLKVSEMRNAQVDKTVDVACQFLVQNTRTDRQVKHQPKQNEIFQQTAQTPLSIGLPIGLE
uniref:UPF0711 protein C18orf21 homolog isoform X1 n=1 Tax=Myxine glutinosa TaxID=7769 RepID=UPI00358EE243